MNETALIETLRRTLATSREQRNEPFTSDAEIVDLGGSLLALTLDEFSAEDGLSAARPRLLGWDLVVATLSDILAVGAEPRYMLNALAVEPDADRKWVAAFAAGAQDALTSFGAAMLGGDVGSADAWRFAGLGLGVFPAGQGPVSRIAESDRGVVLATGTFGDGNRAAVSGVAPRFECRLAESRRLAREGAARIDTSDGLAAALETFARLDPGLRIEVDLDAVPLAEGVPEAARAAGVPIPAFLLGSAGEYELLSLEPEGRASGAGLRRVGTFERSGEGGVFYRLPSGRRVRQPRLPDPREVADLAEYRTLVVDLARTLFGEGGRP
jgi:thiamine-monophosphate kinase